MVARVFLDSDLKLFDYCPQRLLNSVPVSYSLICVLLSLQYVCRPISSLGLSLHQCLHHLKYSRLSRKYLSCSPTGLLDLKDGTKLHFFNPFHKQHIETLLWQEMFAFPVLQDFWTTLAARSGYK